MDIADAGLVRTADACAHRVSGESALRLQDRRPLVDSHLADGTLWLRPHGRFTFIECGAADAAFVAAGADVQRVVVTLDAVDSIDSSAAGLLLYMLHALGERRVEVRGARASVDGMLRRMCLDQLLVMHA